MSDPAEQASVEAVITMAVPGDHQLCELVIERALLAEFEDQEEWRPPRYTRWPRRL